IAAPLSYSCFHFRTATTVSSLSRMLVQKFDDGVLAEIDLEALHFDLDLLQRKTFRDLYPLELSGDVRRRPFVDPRMALGIAVARSIDRHLFILKSARTPPPPDVVPPN